MSLRRAVLALAILASLAACDRGTTSTQPTPAATAAAVAATSGIDLAGIDKAVQPGDDFDAYANGAWKQATEIPEDRANVSTFFYIAERGEKRLADLIQGLDKSEAAAGSNERKIADYYAAFMDEAGIESRGLAPLQPTLDKVSAISDRTSLSRYLGGQVRADTDPLNDTNFHTDNLFGLFVAQGLEDPSKNVGYLMQGGLGMPDREYYLASGPGMDANRAAYQAYIASLLTLAGDADADRKAKTIFDLEMKIAKAHANVIDSQDVHKANNPWPTADLAKQAPGIDWSAFLDGAGLASQQTIFAWQPQAISKLSALVASEPLQTWKDYLQFRAIDHSASLLPKAYADLKFAFYNTQLQGTVQQRDRWKRAIADTNGALGDAIGQLYVKQYFPASSKARVEAMVSNILAAFRDGVDQLAWMSPETRQIAKTKAETMLVGVGYPDSWRDYSAYEVKRDDPLGNALRAEQAEYRHQTAKLGKAPDRKEWWMTPQRVNAVQLPLQNAMNFPAAILEAPFFDPKADDAANYGAIGAVIGHEVSHGFDNLGSAFDAEGRLRNWWTKDDAAHFKAATDKLVAQYNSYEALPGLTLNGEQTLGENIADVAGLQAAYTAYRASLGGKPAPVIDGLTGDERFFLAFGQAWRAKFRDESLRAQVIGGGHSPARWRALTVRNIDAWYETFKVKDGQKLYLKPEDRVKIW
ncbi:M13 family metallopeptidase [Thermomonas carbonis]|uniref:M13 family metallopeptidase n=1 Tax=Thermomonas carbonis TaxID=1463158 RepID=A0A7G9SSQ3_9GAMM|nr:M13 family metallopeptidase [Thermomonas carbonis]QNN70878.1 M13 family metallopeptidase [Thermomonas carbonis]GHC03041.1 peptidase M13 [Thermomonas carbonis]